MTISSLSGINTINLGINTRHPSLLRYAAWSHRAKYRETVQNAANIYQDAVIRGPLWSSAVIFTPDIDFCGGRNVHKARFIIDESRDGILIQ